jgi:hypothetical protein
MWRSVISAGGGWAPVRGRLQIGVDDVDPGCAGVALCALGGVWIAQGSGAMHGSMMTGHGRYTALGGLAVLIGLALIGWSLLVLRRTGRDKR